MPSQSDADRALREHRVLLDETNAIQQAHDSLESAPFDAASHRAHRERIVRHRVRLLRHAERQRAMRRK